MTIFNNVYRFWLARNNHISLWGSLAALFFGLVKLPIDPDLGWHIKQGEVIFLQRQFITSDQFSHTMTGYPWAPYWPMDILIYFFAKTSSLTFLSFLFATIATLAVGLIVLKIGFPKPRLAAFVVLINLLLLYPFAGIRVQVLSWLFLSLTYLLLLFKNYRKSSQIIFYLPLFLLWANFHFGFLLGLALIVLALVIEIVKYLVKLFSKIEFFEKSDPKDIFRLSTVLLIAAVSTLINPNGWGLYRSAFGFLGSRVNTENIVEWLPLNFRSDIGFGAICLVALTFLVVVKSYKKLSFFEIGTFIFLTIATLTSTRNLPYLLIVQTAVILRSNIDFKFPANPTFNFLKNFYYPSVILITCVALSAWSFTTAREANDLKIISQKGNYPNQAVNFLKTNLPSGKMFNEYNWGGFLIWQLPQAKTFIDGRMPGWKTDGRDILTDYLAIYKVSDKTLSLLENYDISWALLSVEAPVTAYLKLAGWTPIYADDKAVILQKEI